MTGVMMTYRRGSFRTTRAFRFIWVLLLVSLPVVSQDSSETPVYMADMAISEGRLEEAEDILSKSLEDAGDEEAVSILWRLSKVVFLQSSRYKSRFEAGGRNADGSRITRRDVIESFGRGVEFGDRAVSLFETTGAGADEAYLAYYWRGTNIGQQGNVRGLLASLFAIDDIRSNMEKTIAMEPAFPDPHFVLCQMYTRVPGWSRETAVKYGRTALRLHEDRVRRGEDDWDPEFVIILSGALAAFAKDADGRDRKDDLLSEAAGLLRGCRNHVVSDPGYDDSTRAAKLERIDAFLEDTGLD